MLLCVLVIGGIVYVKAGQSFEQTKEYSDLMLENPFLKTKLRKSSNDTVIAKGAHVNITSDELEWMTQVMELNDSSNPSLDAYNELCRFKSLLYIAASEGYTISDDELDARIRENIDVYNEAKKEGYVDALYENFEGAEAYETMHREATRKSMLTEKYLSDKMNEFYKTFTSEITEEEKRALWLEERKAIEAQAIESEQFKRLD
ncbi:hypothetical protein GKG47_14500 [Lactonifactor sp. BIOML-A3]|uniref:hypothetical protein n=1 Tax=unclassified Lactonifactor TaxID=2636670 RepID=UPI0012B06161|nr:MULTISPECIES: hypothetical protein [unclassified Lactonifactor]MSA02998.1 hypothetical protein [Lactonifactor sp. BIOML-A5]MSA09229.1 hypothetical protein [Lactonifactor sp. BIOML-A4]MSA13640.1 hypothetical protein [Lactonifactor sp. BIOML-A3]MSA18222.1 hypothetical protein [Lactonifactor sp. BIOML-A2]MSA39189.1 hypothetical protein [Lactonifactor sp. BIOML-A1]